MRYLDAYATLVVMSLSAPGCRVSSAAPAESQVTANAASGARDGSPAPAASASQYVKPARDELRRKLTPIQFEVSQNDATEPPFHNEFWDNHAPGIYVDVATGEPLFSSLDKFESGTGWPSFTRPIEDGRVVSHSDMSLGMMRTEVRSGAGDSHLGHVLDDGPPPTRLRYCINSASLRFVPLDRLAAEGYGAYRARFAGPVPESPAPASTVNACATPPPGEQPGCAATLDTALLAGGRKTRDALSSLPGVLEVVWGTVAHSEAVRVVFDPKQIAYGELIEKWARTEAADASATRVVYVATDDQRRIAEDWATRTGPSAARRAHIVVHTANVTAFTPTPP